MRLRMEQSGIRTPGRTERPRLRPAQSRYSSIASDVDQRAIVLSKAADAIVESHASPAPLRGLRTTGNDNPLGQRLSFGQDRAGRRRHASLDPDARPVAAYRRPARIVSMPGPNSRPPPSSTLVGKSGEQPGRFRGNDDRPIGPRPLPRQTRSWPGAKSRTVTLPHAR